MTAPGTDTEKHEGAARAFYRLPTPINALELARADAFALRNFDHGMAIVKARDELLALREERAQLISALRAAIDALNQIPNRRLSGADCDTYALLTRIELNPALHARHPHS